MSALCDESLVKIQQEHMWLSIQSSYFDDHIKQLKTFK